MLVARALDFAARARAAPGTDRDGVELVVAGAMLDALARAYARLNEPGTPGGR